MEDEKRKVSILIPIKKINGKLLLFMQHRTEDMTLPNHFGFWGGGAEGNENPKEALAREIKEELGVTLEPARITFFSQYEFLESVKHVYLYQPPEHWEASHVIGEGDYGTWLSPEETLAKPNIIFEDKVVIDDL